MTGTHIRGDVDSASAVQVYSRAQIDATGSTTVQQFLQTLPQNFNGGASEFTIGAITGAGQSNNNVAASSPNLRGLGNNATLVLIDGHRVAPGNTDGSFVDVSMIPLAAIERIEIVTDGASAIYGSDAVGGVVNIILRHQFNGAESTVQYGTVESGARRDIQVGQTLGEAWEGGSAVISYQYFDQTQLSAASRSYTASLQNPYPFSLTPEQVQQAVFATFNQQIASGFSVQGDATYSHRSTDEDYSQGAEFLQNTFNAIDNYSATLGSRIELPGSSRLAIAATYSESDTSGGTLQTPGEPSLIVAEKDKSAIVSLDANLDGVLFSLPAGAVRYAVGAQYREESYGHNNLLSTDDQYHPSRHVDAGYAELHIPIIGRDRDGHDPVLELTAADRQEHYSDFGSTNNPQLGVIWKPISGLKFRGTYGTSFTAPVLYELNPIPTQIVGEGFTDPKLGGSCGFSNGGFVGSCTNSLIVDGGNPQLGPEKATTWTVGLDITPELMPGFTARLTYYDIVFKDQIGTVAGAISCICNGLIDEAFLGSAIVQRNPPASLVQQLVASPNYVNYFKVDPSTITAIVDGRYLNLSTTKTRGVDFGLSYKSDVLRGVMDLGIDGTRILAFDNEFGGSSVSILNTVFNPTDLKLRGHAILTQGSLSAGVFLNYVGPLVSDTFHSNFNWLSS